MDEKYLHLLWEMKRIPSSELVTTCGRSIEILSFGICNDQLAGPDFFFGRVKYEGLIHYGMIEIHVKSSDWYVHNHHNDPRYNNVILHVVYQFDRSVIQNGMEIPTIELKPFVDPVHFKNYQNGLLKTVAILCQNQLADLSSVYLESMKSKALVMKLDSKVEKTVELIGNSRESVLYALITQVFGTSVNSKGYERIISHIPMEKVFENGRLKKELFISSVHDVYAEYQNTSEWHLKGVRPAGNPLKRISELAHTLDSIDLLFLAERIDLKYVIDRLKVSIESLKLTRFLKDQLLINAVAPYLWYLGEELRDELFKECAIELLEQINPEDNRLSRLWKKQNVRIDSAYDSQSLNAVFRYFCSHKNCLSCEVGNKLLKR